MMMALMCALALVGLNSCSDDDDEPTETERKAEGYFFVMEFTRVEDSAHKDLINTTYTYTKTNGEVEKKPVTTVAGVLKTVSASPFPKA